MGTHYFDINRKIIASMTSESWKSVPHVCIVYEADVDLLSEVLTSWRSQSDGERISFNAALLRLVVEGICACPAMNGHVHYHPWLVSGKVIYLEHIDISMPMRYGKDRMITVTLPQMEKRSMREIQAMIADFKAKLESAQMDRVLFKTGLSDTFSRLRHGHVLMAAGRLAGAKFGPGRVRLTPGTVESGTGLTPDNIRQGSITVSNMGSLYRGWKGNCTILEIIPPQLCALAIGAVQKRPVADREDRVRVAQIVPITIAFDHRALDCGDIVPFMERLDGLLQDRAWLEDAVRQ